MIKQVTVTDLQRRAAEVINSLREGPVVISQRGRPAAVILTAEAYEEMEQAVAVARSIPRHLKIADAAVRPGKTDRSFPVRKPRAHPALRVQRRKRDVEPARGDGNAPGCRYIASGDF